MPQENIHYQAAKLRGKKRKFDHAEAVRFCFHEIAECNRAIALASAFPAFIKAQKLEEKKLKQLKKLATYHAKKTKPKSKKSKKSKKPKTTKNQLEPAISLVDLELLASFETANDIETSLTLYADGSGTLNTYNIYHEFENPASLRSILTTLHNQ